MKNIDPKKYKKYSSSQKEEAFKLLKSYKFKKNSHILDIGCGPGNITQAIAKKVPFGKVLGIDPCPQMIEEAKRSYKNIKNLSFKIIKAEDFYSDKHFDVIVCFSCFQYIKNHFQFLKKIKNLLKPNSTLLIRSLYDKGKYLKEIIKKKDYYFLKKVKWNMQNKSFYYTHLKQLGFIKINIKVVDQPFYFSSSKDVFNWIYASIFFLLDITQKEAIKFCKDFTKKICETKKNEKFKVCLPLLSIDATNLL